MRYPVAWLHHNATSVSSGSGEHSRTAKYGDMIGFGEGRQDASNSGLVCTYSNVGEEMVLTRRA